MTQFILASQSPRRKTLLEWAELPFEIIVSEANENYPANMPIEEVPIFIARNKAIAVKEKIGVENTALLIKPSLSEIEVNLLPSNFPTLPLFVPNHMFPL